MLCSPPRWSVVHRICINRVENVAGWDPEGCGSSDGTRGKRRLEMAPELDRAPITIIDMQAHFVNCGGCGEDIVSKHALGVNPDGSLTAEETGFGKFVCQALHDKVCGITSVTIGCPHLIRKAG